MIVVEKILTRLVMPAGLLWLGLMVMILLAWRRKQKGLLVCIVVFAGLYTAAGNGLLGSLVNAWLERDYAHVDPFQGGSLDAVFVLGGGTSTRPDGQPQFDEAGDRVLMGAELYHAGRTRLLVATGQQIAAIQGAPDPAEEAAEIWRRLGIPADHILKLPGRNTREEMAAIRKAADEHPDWRQLGLVTSAWHMRRAMRLAQKRGLRLEPLPADFRGTPPGWLSIVPSGDGLASNEAAAKEILAVLLGK